MSLYTVYTVIISIASYTETSKGRKGQEDPAEMEIVLGSQWLTKRSAPTYLPLG